MAEPIIYDEGLTDSRRWANFELRPGDIIMSVPSKCGTTWLQMMCAVLVFGPTLPGPLTELSPWLDMRLRPASDVYRRLERQQHRRLIKTHTPLDGLPAHADVTHVVMGRDPRDVAVSMSHHRHNLDDEAIHRALSIPASAAPTATHRDSARRVRTDAIAWIDADGPVPQGLSTLKGMTWHLAQAWNRRADPNVVLLHYAEAVSDLKGTMALLARRLGISAPDEAWPDLVAAATFESMRANATALVPDEGLALFKQPSNFFNSGGTRQWAAVLTPSDLIRYESRIAALTRDDVIAWLHQEA